MAQAPPPPPDPSDHLAPPPTAAASAASQPAQAASAHPPKPPSTHHNHPPYSEMIASAIRALKERNGSSKAAIAKYIDSAYSDLPPSHSALLTHHLKRLKKSGVLLMVKHSYKLPNPSPAAADGAPPKRGRGRPRKLIAAAPASAPPKSRGRGRPPKLALPKPGPLLPNDGLPRRGRGRPPKANPAAAAPPGSGGGGGGGGGVPVGGKGRGRPRKSADSAPGGGGAPAGGTDSGAAGPVGVPPVIMRVGREKGPAKASSGAKPKSGRPRGRPRKINAELGAGDGGEAPVEDSDSGAAGAVGVPPVIMTIGRQRGPPRKPKKKSMRPRGRPPKPGGPKKVERTGRPVGRPRKVPVGPPPPLQPEPEALEGEA